ncbi:hypothetical protein [Pelagicoccus albus]|uniref:Uncharacterized protein n=1 Tax=Pelagicoccus albus TaxID=415222 RepID=A0A7X1E9E2_9BACT|nr:hypothetical protein [Pelagicoccus albus]MBC2607324.1 hypothetical protein [Pelagicoccus albus]
MSQLSLDKTDTHEAERRILEQLWHAGRLQRHIEALERFYSTKRDEFRKLLKSKKDNDELVEIAKFLVIENVIVDQLAETLDQMKEIESEIWIQGESGNYDRDQIALQWTERYAQAWRQWRLKEYLFAIEQMESERLAQCLQYAS